MSEGAIERGPLAATSFPELLWGLHRAGWTGTLALERGSFRKTVYLHDGRVTFARSSNPDDRLGEYLLRRGTIGVHHFLESARRIAPGRRQGAILCEMGAISADELVKLVTEQVTEILYSLFSWTDGEFELGAEPAGAEERIALSIPIEDVILRGIRRVEDWSRIWNGLGGSPDTVFATASKAGGLSYRAALSDDEAHVLALVTGKLPLDRILAVSYASNFATCRMLWALKVVGAIVAQSEPRAVEGEDYALAEMIEEHDRVFTFIHDFVTERIGDLVDHFMDRATALVEERHPEALGAVHLRNQGRVEYEQVFANLAVRAMAERHEQTRAALREVLAVLIALTAKELGPDEEQVLADQLRLLARDVPGVPIAEVLSRKEEPGSAL